MSLGGPLPLLPLIDVLARCDVSAAARAARLVPMVLQLLTALLRGGAIHVVEPPNQLNLPADCSLLTWVITFLTYRRDLRRRATAVERRRDARPPARALPGQSDGRRATRLGVLHLLRSLRSLLSLHELRSLRSLHLQHLLGGPWSSTLTRLTRLTNCTTLLGVRARGGPGAVCRAERPAAAPRLPSAAALGARHLTRGRRRLAHGASASP